MCRWKTWPNSLPRQFILIIVTVMIFEGRSGRCLGILPPKVGTLSRHTPSGFQIWLARTNEPTNGISFDKKRRAGMELMEMDFDLRAPCLLLLVLPCMAPGHDTVYSASNVASLSPSLSLSLSLSLCLCLSVSLRATVCCILIPGWTNSAPLSFNLN